MLVTGNATIMGQTVSLTVGAKSATKTGPVFFYWHGTGSSAAEGSVFMAAQAQEIASLGGVFASFEGSTGKGDDTGDAVWFTGDFDMADEILACAVQQLNIDERRVYTGGCSAGGLQAGAMVYDRSSYLAGAMPNSGGLGGVSGFFGLKLEDPTHVPSLITTHGMMGVDVVVQDFAQSSLSEAMGIAKLGGFAVDCDHGGSHCGAPADDIAAQWQFLKDHPFGVSPDPYAGKLPASFPSYCKIIM
jgi:poly(3-hydroxybutyrate) depolymerase